MQQEITHYIQGTPSKIIYTLFIRNVQVRRQWQDIFKVLKKKKKSANKESSIDKTVLQKSGKNTFPGKQKLRELSCTRPALQ